jgi:hypothetical protein
MKVEHRITMAECIERTRGRRKPQELTEGRCKPDVTPQHHHFCGVAVRRCGGSRQGSQSYEPA